MIIVSQKLDKVFGTNNSYIINGGRRFKNEAASAYQRSWEVLARKHKGMFSRFDSAKHFLELSIVWHNPKFYKKNGELSKTSGDTDGVVKFIKDGICDGIGLNDAFVKKESIIQLNTDSNYHTVSVEVSANLIISLCQ